MSVAFSIIIVRYRALKWVYLAFFLYTTDSVIANNLNAAKNPVVAVKNKIEYWIDKNTIIIKNIAIIINASLFLIV